MLDNDTIAQIMATADVRVRNLRITQSYAVLGDRLNAVYAPNQTWCTFAVWASATAGVSIRGHELPSFVDELVTAADGHIDTLHHHANDHAWLMRRLGLVKLMQRSGLEALVLQAIGEISGYIAHGNTLVFGELAPIFVRFIELLGADTASTDVDELLDAAGVPPASETPHVRSAFRSYAQAARTDDNSVRAQLVLAGNVAAVLHEQRRLQHDIAAGVDAGMVDFEQRVAALCARWLPNFVRDRIVRAASRRASAQLDKIWQHVATRVLMTLAVPGETLHLGVDVPPLPDGHHFPNDLLELDEPALVELMGQWDPTDGTGRGSAAADWCDLHERMGYIVNLFRSRQQHAPLSTPPFSPEQLEQIDEGLVPASI